jgi:multidrug efflux pump subunit AcrA (membrane-fusion protein)
MNKTLKRFIIVVLVIALLCSAVWGSLVLIRNANKQPVNVYAASDFSMSNDYSSSSETYGTVSMDNMQKILLTETQTVKEIYVKEGQTVKKGDKLLSYDTTLTDIDLKKAEIELNKLKQSKTQAENELAQYQKMKPHTSVLVTPSTPEITYISQETPMLLGGSGTADDPFYYLWGEDDSLSLSLLKQMFPKADSSNVSSTRIADSGTEELTADTSASDASTSEEPTSDSSASEEPTSDASAAVASTSDTPASDVSASDEPSSNVSTSEEPSSDVSDADEPTSDVSASENSSSDASTSDEPTLDVSDSDEPDSDTPSATSADESYVVFVVRENNALNGEVLNSFGLHLDKSSGSLNFQFFQASLPDDTMDTETTQEPYYEESGSDYTAEELAQMKAEKQQEIKDLEVSIKIAELELREKEKEATDGTVTSTIDGVIKELRDPTEAFTDGEPVIEVSAGGGYYIEGALSELELGTVQVGQTVQVNSWTTGTNCQGEIVEISTYPTTDSSSYSSDGNTNVSYYPFRIFVDESENLTENDYVDITYQNQVQSEDGSSFYLENSFIRTENGRSYVYIRNENGPLEQRTVQVGKDLYGYYTQIRSGLTMDDYIAFPYGTDVTDGAKTQEATPDTLYEY